MRYLVPQTSRRRGFTLIETSMAMVIIGVALSAVLQLLAAGTSSNLAGKEMSTALNLANNIREFAAGLAYQDPANPTSPNTRGTLSPTAYNDIWDLDTGNFTPPLDCSGQQISSLSGWSQVVKVQSVDPTNLTATRPNDPTVATARITVTVYHGNKYIHQICWVVCAPDAP
jgi:prepilin-type N-terminal cleavage/methylation domain-containing protein